MFLKEVRLAPYTTLGLGGPARAFAEAATQADLVEIVAEADRSGEPVLVLGGGSNLVVSDVGFDGLVVRVATTGIELTGDGLLTAQAGEDWDALVAREASPVGSEALEMHRIVNGIPLYGTDIRERDLPQETEQARALNFSKGCYIGQEIVERIRSRGNVHRMFTGFAVENGAPVEPGAKIAVDEKEVGEVTSVASVPGEPARTVALGYVRREAGMPGREVRIGAAAAKIVKLPFEESTVALSVSH